MVFVEAKRAFSKQPEPPPSSLDAQKPRTLDAQDLRFQPACALRATVTHFLHHERPKCERCSNQSDGTAHSHAYLQQWVSKKRARRSSSGWEGQQLRKFARSSAQNASVVVIQHSGSATVSHFCEVGRPERVRCDHPIAGKVDSRADSG